LKFTVQFSVLTIHDLLGGGVDDPRLLLIEVDLATKPRPFVGIEGVSQDTSRPVERKVIVVILVAKLDENINLRTGVVDPFELEAAVHGPGVEGTLHLVSHIRLTHLAGPVGKPVNQQR